MKYLVNEEPLKKIFQKIINRELNYLQKLKEENWKDIPDDISDYTWTDIDFIWELKVVSVKSENYSGKLWFKVYIDIVYNSATRIYWDEILWDFSQLIGKMLALNLSFESNNLVNKFFEK